MLNKLFYVSFFLFLLTGCSTTAMYTSPSAINQQQNIYNFTIETGGYAGSVEADARASAEIDKFMQDHGYQHYKILYRQKGEWFSGYRYAVRFTR